jgi:hypothetical protein
VQPVYFTGDDTTVAGKIKLTAYLPGGETNEDLTFTLAGKTATGSWTNSATKKTLSFTANEISSTPSWDYVFAMGSTKLKPKMKGSPEASYEAASVWPQGNSEQSMAIKKMIDEWYAKDNSGADIGRIFLKEKKKFFDDYLSENKDVTDSALADNESYNSDETQTINIVYQSSKLLTLASTTYSYTGGAHGNYGTGYLSIDLTGTKKLSLNDILTAAGKKQLGGLLEKYFRKEYNLKPTDPLSEGGLFEEKITATDNFFVTGKGIGFDYPPYEIGPFALGEIVIFIPFTELSANLQNDFKKLVE